MPKRVLWLCWHRHALKLANQTHHLPPSWPPFLQAVLETRNRPAGHLSLETSTKLWMTNPALSLTPSQQATLVRMLWWPRGIRPLSGCQVEAPTEAVRHAHLFRPIPGRPAPALRLCTVRASPKDKAIPPPCSPHHTLRPRPWTANLEVQSTPAQTVTVIALAKKTQMQQNQGWTGPS